MLVGLAGKMRVGKDTVADYLVDRYDFKKVGLADPIKAAVAAMLDISVEDAEKFGRDTPIGWLNDTTFRELWQTLGTEWGRQIIDEDIWIKLVTKNSPRSKNIIISDVRFENEANYIRNNGGIIIHIFKANTVGKGKSHASEKGIKIKPTKDLIFKNDGTITDLYCFIDKLYENIINTRN